MKASKISYCISRSIQIFNSPSNKNKYKKIASQLEVFYREGHNNRDIALSLRDAEIIKNNFMYNKDPVIDFFCLIGIVHSTSEKFINYCNNHKKLKKLFNLE